MHIEHLHVGSCSHPECAVLRGGSLGPISFPAVAVLMIHPTRGAWLFDTGYAERFQVATRPFPQRLYAWTTPMQLPTEQCLLTQLAARGIGAQDIQGIVLSHLHADHCAGVLDFPQAQIWLSREAWRTHSQQNKFNQVRQGFLQALLPLELLPRMFWLEDLAQIPVSHLGAFDWAWDLWGDGQGLLIPLPGHAHGHTGLLLQDTRRGPTFLLADACWSAQALQKRHPPSRLANLIFSDHRAYYKTLNQLCDLRAYRTDLWMVPQHCVQTLKDLNAQ